MRTRARVTALPALLVTGVAASLSFGPKVVGHQATAAPEVHANPYADVGLPELTLDFTVEAISGMPDSIEAGRYLVTINGDPPAEAWAFGTMFLRLPDGMSFEDAMVEAAAVEDDFPWPAFYFDSHLAGGPTILSGSGTTTAQAVIDLPPGDWFVAGGALMQPPIRFTVTGEMPADLPEPESTATVTLGEMKIEVTEGELTAGHNLLRIDNIGAQIHQIEVEKLPDGATRETVQNTLDWEPVMDTGTLPAGEVLDFENIEWVAISMDQSGGTSMWMELDLEPGTYGIFCFVPDEESRMPHAYMGMWDLFEITG